MSIVDDFHKAHKQRLARLNMKPVTAVKSVAPIETVEPVVLPMSALNEWIDRQKQIHKKPWFSIISDRAIEPRNVRLKEIQSTCAKRYAVSLRDILSQRRTANVVRPRQVAMYLAKTLTLRSLPEIGRSFGGRDHTTVLHAVRKIEHLITINPELSDEVAAIKAELVA